MKVVYTAPNRAHHYNYARALHKAGCLHAFISGFPRINPLSKDPVLNGRLHHSDILQTFYIASLKARVPQKISSWLAYLSKIEQDKSCRKFIKDSDVFLFYNGSGLSSSAYARKNSSVTVVEAVNSHIEYQEEILKQEFSYLGINWTSSLSRERNRRVKEYEEADYILLPSEFVKRSFIEKGFPEEKLLKVSYGFNPVQNGPDNLLSPCDDYFTVLYVGTISIRKGIRYLVEAFHSLKHPKKKLVLVGPDINDGALKGIYLTDHIVFKGILKGEELEEEYRSASVFCLPSIEDGFGLVLGEALSFALPIITTCNTGAGDIITQGTEGFIVPIRDSKAIAERLQQLADDKSLLESMSEHSLQKSRRLNGWEECGKQLVETLCKVSRVNEK